MHIVIDGTPVIATIDSGVFATIVPPGVTHQTLLKSTVEAFDSTGTRLDEVPLIP